MIPKFLKKIFYVTFIVIVSFLLHVIDGKSRQSVEARRKRLMDKEARLYVGGNNDLTSKEREVNNFLMQQKLQEINYAFDYPLEFRFNQHYFMYKDQISKSKVYQIIKDMPKGAVLHIHDMGILGADYLMNLTYLDHLYLHFDDNKVRYKFANETPNDTDWKLVSELRKQSDNVKIFDARLRKHFTLVVDNPDQEYSTINQTWNAFMNFFVTVESLITYRPVWEKYFYDALEEFRRENILYVEVRTILPNLYDLDGTVHHQLVTAKTYKDAIKRFVQKNPDFIGAKLIFAPLRHSSLETLKSNLQLARLIQEDMPEYFAGFDLVGQEDLGGPLVDFLPVLSNVKDMNFFFHAGETNWYGCPSDENLFDAILLRAKRLGHAFALPKHPLLVREVIKRQICVEVNVVSNIVLALTRDVRSHPLTTLLAQGVPVVLSSDDPGAWEADLISHDYYIAFVAATHKHADLKLLKTLFFNSITFSALTYPKKELAFNLFCRQWERFVDKFDCSKY